MMAWLVVSAVWVMVGLGMKGGVIGGVWEVWGTSTRLVLTTTAIAVSPALADDPIHALENGHDIKNVVIATYKH